MHEQLNLQQQIFPIPNIISDLWIPNSKVWDTYKIQTVFNAETALAIQGIQVSCSQEKDHIYWETYTI